MSDQKKVIFKRLKQHNTIWHPDSTLVFKSQKEKLVIGRYYEEKLIDLDDLSLELCEKWNFKPDESLLEEKNSEEGEEEEEEGEEEEGEEEEGEKEEGEGEEDEEEEEGEEEEEESQEEEGKEKGEEKSKGRKK